MHDELRAIAIFATVAECGSFSAAGRRLQLATSVVSHHVSRLEERLGTALLYRSTRALSLTDDGRRLADAAQRMLASAREGLDALADGHAAPAGHITVTLPAFAMNSAVERSIWAFASLHNRVEITLRATDRQVDLIGEGYDLGIRLGEMRDSALRSRRIGTFERKLVSAPSYLATKGPIESVEVLRGCDFVTMERLPDEILLERGGEQVAIRPGRGRIVVDSVGSARSAVIAGLGVQRLPVSEIADDLEQGRLVELMEGWALPTLGIFAVWPPSSAKSSLTARLVDHMHTELGSSGR